MEPQIGIRGRWNTLLKPHMPDWSFNGAPDRNLGKGLDPDEIPPQEVLFQWSPR